MINHLSSWCADMELTVMGTKEDTGRLPKDGQDTDKHWTGSGNKTITPAVIWKYSRKEGQCVGRKQKTYV